MRSLSSFADRCSAASARAMAASSSGRRSGHACAVSYSIPRAVGVEGLAGHGLLPIDHADDSPCTQ